MFRYFHQYINTKDVRVVVQDGDDLLKRSINQQIGCIETELKRGTSSDHDFGPSNAGVVTDILSRLQALREHYPDQIDCDYI